MTSQSQPFTPLAGDQLRPVVQIRQAHDLLEDVLDGTVPIHLKDELSKSVVAALYIALCWVLNHPSPPGSGLAELLDEWRTVLAAKACEATDGQ